MFHNVYLTEKHIVKGELYKDLCRKAKVLYNQSLYYCRQSIFGKIQYFNENELTKLFAEFNEESYRDLPTDTAREIIKLLFKDIKCWYRTRKEYLAKPNKFVGRPKLPKYKKEYSIVLFSKHQLSLKGEFLHFPKKSKLLPIKTRAKNVCQVRILPNSDHFTLEVVYEKQEEKQKAYNGNWMGIDLGMNNLATCVTNTSATIYNGKPLKAINHFYNIRKGKLQSQLGEGQHLSKRINRLTLSRNNKIQDSIHQISNKIIRQAENENTTKIIIGNNKNWKHEINLGRNNNRNFVSIPHSALIDKIKYKGLMAGIEVLITQEAYTSKCSALDLEPICKHETYLGKRVKRGLFKTSDGAKINADCNGALNIARLVAGDEIISDSVRSCVSQPNVVNILQKCKHN